MTDLTDLHMYLKKMDEKLFRLENKVDNLNVKLVNASKRYLIKKFVMRC